MTSEMITLLTSIIGPSVAAYVSVRVALAQALAKAENAIQEANRAHRRIDAIIDRRHA